MSKDKNKSCTKCELYSLCHFEPHRKMYNRKCYIDQLSERIKKSPATILKQLIEIDDELYLDTAMIAYSFSRNEWILLDQSERKYIMAKHIERFRDWRLKHEDDYTPLSEDRIERYTSLLVSVLNTCYNAWRNEQFVPCLRCGKTFENNKQRNRKYCDACAGYQPTTVWKTCVDCGIDFKLKGHNHRQFRCSDCQADANKESARLRSKRYRQHKKSRYQTKD